MSNARNIALGLTVVASTISIIDTIKTERAKRKQIQLDTEKEIAAIKTSGEIVRKMIQAGEINSIDEAMEAVTFYKIVLTSE